VASLESATGNGLSLPATPLAFEPSSNEAHRFNPVGESAPKGCHEWIESKSLDKPPMPEKHWNDRRRAPRFFEYRLPGDWVVLAGRTDADNDYLSVVAARPRDWWFHVRGLPGSHVILRAKPDQEPDRKTLRGAASVAAFHSKARGGGTVAVSVTRAQDVTKPPGSKPGTVQIRKESVVMVKPALPEPSATGPHEEKS
jgi:predicted ribosome quality control (RQC) complex YloA/Tae2 family protein